MATVKREWIKEIASSAEFLPAELCNSFNLVRSFLIGQTKQDFGMNVKAKLILPPPSSEHSPAESKSGLAH